MSDEAQAKRLVEERFRETLGRAPSEHEMREIIATAQRYADGGHLDSLKLHPAPGDEGDGRASRPARPVADPEGEAHLTRDASPSKSFRVGAKQFEDPDAYKDSKLQGME
jgi:hypothetical protein